MTAGLTSGGVRGRFDVDGAFDRLLAGTGLVALRQPGGGYTLTRADGSAARPVAAGTAPAAAAAGSVTSGETNVEQVA